MALLKTEVISDKWVDTISCHRSLGKEWTGRTFFYRQAATNMMFAGALLASICPQSTCLSQVGQPISPDATNSSLVGPVFGKRVVVYEGAPGGSWEPASRPLTAGAAVDGSSEEPAVSETL